LVVRRKVKVYDRRFGGAGAEHLGLIVERRCKHRLSGPLQRRKNADLQDSGLIYDHGDGVALFTSELSVITRSDRDWGSRPFVETQPGNQIVKQLRMAGAIFELQ
jgi:hypothetical protein